MIVITLTDCPPGLRGDLTKWLLEVNTGVYTGHLSTRIREMLWKRICENLKNGRATMVYSTNNEQGLEFRVHNTQWEPVDFDGITLMRRPLPDNRKKEAEDKNGVGQSRAGSLLKTRRINEAATRADASSVYVVLDVETTGLDVSDSSIIEIAALRCEENTIIGEYEALIATETAIPKAIVDLTGITGEMLKNDGQPLENVLKELIEFIGKSRIVCHNSAFDLAFLRVACRKCGFEPLRSRCTDTLTMARQCVHDVSDYKLETLAKHFSIDTDGHHRALNDCRITHRVYCKLNEIMEERI